MTPADLSLTVAHAVRRAVGDGDLAVRELPGRLTVERPRPGGLGDWATNAALQLARPSGLPPREVAEVLRRRLLDVPGIARVDITGPGFLNLTLRPDARAGAGRLLVERVRREGMRYGYGDALAGLPEDRVHFRVAEGADPRVRALTAAVAALLRSQGAPARVSDGARRDAHPGVRLHARPPHYDLAALPPDARQWAMLRPAPHDRVLDAAPLLRQTESGNGLFTVQYAHARSAALLRNAADLGFSAAHEDDRRDARPGAAYDTHPGASELLAALGDHPAVLLAAARHHAPDRLARHLEVLADAFLGFQHTVLPLGDEKPSAAHRSRLALAEAAGTVLAGGLSLLGVSAPTRL
ncbi:ArgS-related anticodon-binding protein NrtL [Streptomyces fradiae]|uniref:ArgS-related anticodon-binding protein NrtL n=1 Tax=Streptomyces fradiae TaxID=1906 RepID=UPI0029437D38|nr:DALR anticodon-binding domain-containing protein [Streptomyces fradiae]WOI62443.1 DALR anticodon-binding domain-containing protein [Streptomyces fradiae]